MAIFNSVLFKCPYCGSTIEFQSKCDTDYYWQQQFQLASVPLGIAEDMEAERAKCPTCNWSCGFEIVDKPPNVEVVIKSTTRT